MAIALFNDQETLAGQKLGISTGKAFGLIIMASGLAAMNIYHMGNAVTSKLLTPESSIFAYALLYFIAACIAFMEIPVTEEIVTQEARGRKAKGHRMMLGVVVTMAIGAGLYSITSDADKRATTVTSHETAERSFNDLQNALISDRNIARAGASTSAERSQANAEYFRALAALKLEQSKHQLTRPSLAVKTDSIFHWAWAIGLSLLCSLGVVVITAYLTKYHKPLTEIPRVFFKVREDQAWAMNDDDVRVIPASVNLAGGSSTGAARKSFNTPPPTAKKEKLTSPDGRAAPNRPELVPTTMGAVLNSSKKVSVRTPNTETQKGGEIEYSNEHYKIIKLAIMTREIPPTIRPVKSKMVELGIRFITDAERQNKANEVLELLAEEGVLINNPEFGKTGKIEPKFIYNQQYGKGDLVEDSEQKEQGGMLVLTCPDCGETLGADEGLLVEDKGVVCCPDCYTEFNAMENLKSSTGGQS